MEDMHRNNQEILSPMSPVQSPLGKDYKDIEQNQNKNDSLTSVDIQEMERVRLSLQSMLKSSELFLQDDKALPKSIHTSPDDKRYSTRDHDMFPSINTANLMSSYLNTDTTEARMSSDSKVVREDNETTRKSSKNYDKSLLIENALLNESLEKERSKRKHCEQQIKGLQSKLLETQQELAAAVSADRKKDVMITQLDKTLARVVEDWKKHEEEKFDAMNKLEVQHENDTKFQQRQQEILAQFEKDLSLAAEALSQEQGRAANAEREKDSQIAALLHERDELTQLLEEEKAKNTNLNDDYESLGEDLKTVKESQNLLEHEKQAWQDEKSQLESQIEQIAKSHTDDLENEKRLVEHEKQVAQDSQRVLSAVQKEVQQLTVQLDTCFREKENLKTEITLLTAKFEAQRTRKDSEHRAELERQISKNLRDAQSQLSKSENEIKMAHKKQIEELTTEYKRDLEEQLNNFHQQLKEKERKMKETSEEYEERLMKSHNNLLTISTEREAMRNEKQKMIIRLQKMMQSHCAEAMSVLTATTEGRTIASDERHDSTWMLRQTPVLVTSAAHVGPVRDSTQAFPTFVTPGNYGHVMQSSTMSDRSQVEQQQLRYTHDAHVTKTESDETVHNWIKLPTMPDDKTHLKNSNTSYYPDETVVNEHRRTLQENVGEKQQRKEPNCHYSHGNSQDSEIEEKEISPTTTNESLIEQSPDDLETTQPHLPMNLSTDVLKMLQQQQSRQTELNHYVHQLLKKSPSSISNDEDFANIAVVTSDDGYDAKTAKRTANEKEERITGNSQPDMLSSESSDLGNVKQSAFTKSAATPGKRYSKIPVAQTPPSKDKPLGRSSEKSALTPEQVGQLARLIQMYQKEKMENDVPPPQKMFEYLREVHNRSDNRIPSRNTSMQEKDEFFEESMNSAETSRKESKAKRKLEINAQPGKLKGVRVHEDPDVTRNSSLSGKYFSDETRRPGRTTLTSESELAIIRKQESKSIKPRKTQNFSINKTAKRGTGKSSKAWK